MNGGFSIDRDTKMAVSLSPSMHLQSLSYFLCIFLHLLLFAPLAITRTCVSQLTSNLEGSKGIMQHIYDPIFIQIKLRITELCMILKITKMICCHAYRVIRLME